MALKNFFFREKWGGSAGFPTGVSNMMGGGGERAWIDITVQQAIQYVGGAWGGLKMHAVEKYLWRSCSITISQVRNYKPASLKIY